MTSESDRRDDVSRDPALDAAWRAQPRETPPPSLDAAILAAAHRAAGSGPRKTSAEALRPPKWWLPFAAAAVIGVVAVGLVQLAPHDVIGVSTPPGATVATSPQVAPAPQVSTAPTPTAAAPAAAKAKAEADEAKPAEAVATDAVREKTADAQAGAAKIAQAPAPAALPTPSPAPVARPPVPAVASTPPAAPTSPLTSARRSEAEPAPAKARAAAPESAPAAPMPQRRADAAPPQDVARSAAPEPNRARDAESAPAANPTRDAGPAPSTNLGRSGESSSAAGAREAASGGLGQLAKPRAVLTRAAAVALARDPDAWIVRIRKLRDDGRETEAIAELREFDTLVPEARRRMPADLRRLLERDQ